MADFVGPIENVWSAAENFERTKAPRVVLEWMRPPGVAPERMPKADATGLAPKKSVNPLVRPEDFRFSTPGSQG